MLQRSRYSLRRFLSIFLFLFATAALAVLPSQAEEKTVFREIHCKHFIHGVPLGTPRTNDLIIRDIYAMSSNDSTKFADWVAYRLDSKTVARKEGAGAKRIWKADPWLAANETLEPSDYRGAAKALGVDRGHQAPLASFRGTACQSETNYLSNITPQKASLNRGAWKRLESRIRTLAAGKSRVYVMTGPLYESKTASLPGADEPHRIPSGYWKIVLCEGRSKSPSSLRSASFIFSQSTRKGTKLKDHLVSIDEVERRSGLNFLWELPDELESRIERRVKSKWALSNFK